VEDRLRPFAALNAIDWIFGDVRIDPDGIVAANLAACFDSIIYLTSSTARYAFCMPPYLFPALLIISFLLVVLEQPSAIFESSESILTLPAISLPLLFIGFTFLSGGYAPGSSGHSVTLFEASRHSWTERRTASYWNAYITAFDQLQRATHSSENVSHYLTECELFLITTECLDSAGVDRATHTLLQRHRREVATLVGGFRRLMAESFEVGLSKQLNEPLVDRDKLEAALRGIQLENTIASVIFGAESTFRGHAADLSEKYPDGSYQSPSSEAFNE